MIQTIGHEFDERYQIHEEIGQGSMGVVHRGYDKLLEREVAVKFLSDRVLNAAAQSALLQEAQSAAGLNHPNIAAIYDVGKTEHRPFIVMELIRGASLASNDAGPLHQTIGIARQICLALEHAHAMGIIHRDLKLENVIVASDGTAKLVDFGLAIPLADISKDKLGALRGTLPYLAPELIQGKQATPQTDLYALGVLLYELTTGQSPFVGDDVLSILTQHIEAEPNRPSDRNPEIGSSLDRLILQLVSKRAEDRQASAKQVRLELESLEPAEAVEVFGHAATASHMRLIQEASIRSLSQSQQVREQIAWVAEYLNIKYLAPLSIGESAQVETRMASISEKRSIGEYRVFNRATGDDLASAQAEWKCIELVSGREISLPRHISAINSSGSSKILASPSTPLSTLPPPPPGAVTIRMTVNWRDVGPGELVTLEAYVAYLLEAALEGGERAGWSMNRLRGEGVEFLVQKLKVNFDHPALLRDSLIMITWVSGLARSSGWRNYKVSRESDGLPILKARTRFVCVNKGTGLPTEIPSGFLIDMSSQESS